MKLFEAILDANHRAIAGDTSAGVRPDEFQDELPVIGLTCIDPRLGPLIPEVLGITEAQFIWLRNAGNIITGPLSSTMRSLALACAVKGGKEIAIIGHTDCQISRTTTMQLLDRLKAIGVERHLLPDNINDFFGVFSSERQNVVKACDIVRSSPLIGPKIPVHGLLVDIQTGKLEWLVNGYEKWATMSDKVQNVVKSAGQTVDALKDLAQFKIGEIKFPETKIGETVAKTEDWLAKKLEQLGTGAPSSAATPQAPAQAPVPHPAPSAPANPSTPPVLPGRTSTGSGIPLPPKVPMPPPIRPRMHMKPRGK